MLSVGDEVYRWADVVQLAQLGGEWAELQDDVRSGLVALREIDRSDEPLDEEEVAEAGRTFRYERGLLSADELEAWLDRNGLTTEEWEAHLQRAVARDRVPDAVAATDADPEIEAETWVEGICSGVLEEVAYRLAAFVAVAPGAPLEQAEAELEEFSQRTATDEAIVREIDGNRLEWIRFRYDAIDFTDEDAAREAALCVRSEGDSLAQVAERAGVPLEEREDWLDEVDPGLAPRFLAAEQGAVIGPVQAADHYVVAHVHEKTPPTVDDEDVRARAGWAVTERAVERQINERVVWLEPF